jgi:hypothetical protein
VWYDRGLPSGFETNAWMCSAWDPECLLKEYPFRHFRIGNLLLPDVFVRLSESVGAQMRESDLERDADAREMMYGPLLVRGAVEFFCGPYFRGKLSELVAAPVARHPGSVPQLRINRGPSPELPVHNDEHATFHLATFFFVHRNWEKQAGGALQLCRPIEGGMEVAEEFAPDPNSMIGMIFSKTSFHRVTPITRTAERVAIYQEWQLGE